MSESLMSGDLAREIVESIERRVGKVGSRSVKLSTQGKPYESVGLSRGGIVIMGQSMMENYQAKHKNAVYTAGYRKGLPVYPDSPEPARPQLEPELATVIYHRGTDDEAGSHGDGATLSRTHSHNYVFREEEGTWRAYDAFTESTSNYWTDTTTYFLKDARPIRTDEEGISIQGLISAFDLGLEQQAARAVVEESAVAN